VATILMIFLRVL